MFKNNSLGVLSQVGVQHLIWVMFKGYLFFSRFRGTTFFHDALWRGNFWNDSKNQLHCAILILSKFVKVFLHLLFLFCQSLSKQYAGHLEN